MMSGYYRIPVNSEVYKLVKYYSKISKLSMAIVTELLYTYNVNVYNENEVREILSQFKKTKKIR